MTEKIDLNALGQAMDTTFTRSSASHGPVINTHSVKAVFVGHDETPKIKVTYTVVVNMVRDRELVESKARYEKEGDSYIDAAIKQISKDYKEWVAENSKQNVKFDRVDVGTSIEIVDLNVHNQKRTALFRRTATFNVK
jgi:hypothetical protein